jgi:hypothetical protein
LNMKIVVIVMYARNNEFTIHFEMFEQVMFGVII